MSRRCRPNRRRLRSCGRCFPGRQGASPQLLPWACVGPHLVSGCRAPPSGVPVGTVPVLPQGGPCGSPPAGPSLAPPHLYTSAPLHTSAPPCNSTPLQLRAPLHTSAHLCTSARLCTSAHLCICTPPHLCTSAHLISALFPWGHGASHILLHHRTAPSSLLVWGKDRDHEASGSWAGFLLPRGHDSEARSKQHPRTPPACAPPAALLKCLQGAEAALAGRRMCHTPRSLIPAAADAARSQLAGPEVPGRPGGSPRRTAPTQCIRPGGRGAALMGRRRSRAGAIKIPSIPNQLGNQTAPCRRDRLMC